MHENIMTVRRVEVAIFKRYVRNVADLEGDVIHLQGRRHCLRQLYLRPFRVYAMEFTGGDGLGKPGRYTARPATEIKHAHTGFEMRQQVCRAGSCIALHERREHFLAEAYGVAGRRRLWSV